MKNALLASVLLVIGFSTASAQSGLRVFGAQQFMLDDNAGGSKVFLTNTNGSLGIDNSGTTSPGIFPSTCALLDLSSTTKGFLPPRMTTAQELAICGGTPPAGLVVFNTTTGTLDVYSGGMWGATGWALNGNNLSGGSPTTPTQFFGSNNNYDVVLRSNGSERMRILSGGNVAIGATTSTARLQVTESGTTQTAIDGIHTAATGTQPGVSGETNSQSASAYAVLGTVTSTTPGGFSAAVRGVNNGTGGLGIGVYGSQAGSGWGVYGTAPSGIGVFGQSTTGNGVYAYSTGGNSLYALQDATGTNSAAKFENFNASNINANILNVVSNGNGNIPDHSVGNVANFFANNTNGVGAAVRGEVNSIFGNNGTAGIYGVSSGTGGYAGYFESSNAAGAGITIFAHNAGSGDVISAAGDQNGNGVKATVYGTGSAIYGIVPAAGTGVAGRFENNNATNINTNVLTVVSNGNGNIPDHSVGNVASFFANNTNGVGAAVRGEVNSIFGNNGTAGIYGVASGTGGYAGYFENSNAAGAGLTIFAHNAGNGDVISAAGDLNGNGVKATVYGTGSAIYGVVPAAGTGVAGRFENNNATNINVNTLDVTTVGNGNIPDNTKGNAASFKVNNTNSVAAAVRGEVNTIFGNFGAAAVFGVASGTGGYAGQFYVSNASNNSTALMGITEGAGWAGQIASNNATNANALRVSTPAAVGGTAFNVSNGTISYSTQNPYVTGTLVDDAHLVVTAAGNVTIPTAAPTTDGTHIYVINNSGGVVTVTNTTVGGFNINNGRACEFIYIQSVSGANWIPVQP